jgi:hypothetical protein
LIRETALEALECWKDARDETGIEPRVEAYKRGDGEWVYKVITATAADGQRMLVD